MILFVLSSAKWYMPTPEGRSTLKLCTFYVALLKMEICSYQPLLDHYFAQKISRFHVRLQAKLLLLLTEYHQGWIFLFTITGIKMPLSELCSVLYFNLGDNITWGRSWLGCAGSLHQGLQWNADRLCGVRICPLLFKERTVSVSFGSPLNEFQCSFQAQSCWVCFCPFLGYRLVFFQQCVWQKELNVFLERSAPKVLILH